MIRRAVRVGAALVLAATVVPAFAQEFPTKPITVIVPFAMVPNAPPPPLPDGFAARPAPFGVSFTGMACSEPRLIELAYAFEQATKRRVPPPSTP